MRLPAQTRPRPLIAGPSRWGSSQSVRYPIRGASAIENRPNTCRTVFDPIVHSVWESFGKQSEIAIMRIMHSPVNAQRKDVRPQGIEKIFSQPLGLPFVKPITIRQVGGGLFQNLDLHLIRSRTACLASAISRKREAPSDIRLSRTHRMSACHAGEGTSEALRERSAQISSMASSLSVALILLRGITSCIRPSDLEIT